MQVADTAIIQLGVICVETPPGPPEIDEPQGTACGRSCDRSSKRVDLVQEEVQVTLAADGEPDCVASVELRMAITIAHCKAAALGSFKGVSIEPLSPTLFKSANRSLKMLESLLDMVMSLQ